MAVGSTTQPSRRQSLGVAWHPGPSTCGRVRPTHESVRTGVALHLGEAPRSFRGGNRWVWRGVQGPAPVGVCNPMIKYGPHTVGKCCSASGGSAVPCSRRGASRWGGVASRTTPCERMRKTDYSGVMRWCSYEGAGLRMPTGWCVLMRYGASNKEWRSMACQAEAFWSCWSANHPNTSCTRSPVDGVPSVGVAHSAQTIFTPNCTRSPGSAPSATTLPPPLPPPPPCCRA